MRAAIEHFGGEIASVEGYTAWRGFRELGYEILAFERGDAEAVEADPEIVVVGGMASVRAGLRRIGVELPFLANVPDPLLPFAGRRLWTTTMGEVRERVHQGAPPVFVKPAPHMHKLFTAMVVRGFRDLVASAAVPDEEPVICSEVVEFRSEYRVFVHHGRPVDCRRYRGSYRILPDFERIEAALEAYAGTAPAGYALDAGVDAQGRTLLVEVNDGYSLGTYGMEPVPYARLLAARWSEIAGTPAPLG